jgi:hypothetical protein
MAHVSALLKAEESSPEYEIGWAVWMTRGRDDVLEYLTEVMTSNMPGSRSFEVAREITLLLGVTGAAA